MTLAIPNNGSIPPGTYLLTAENWNPSVVVLGVGVCTPTCTEAGAGAVRFATTVPGSLQITGISFSPSTSQIGVEFVDPPQSVDLVQVLPWLGYQWGNPVSWNPNASGIGAGELFIKVGGCHPGQSYTVLITLSDATGQSAQQKFTYTCP